MQRKIYTTLGEIVFDLTFKANIKAINIRIKADGKVLVSAPIGVKFSLVDEVVANHAKFIQKHLEKAQERRQSLENDNIEEIYLLGSAYKLIFISNDIFQIKMVNNIIYLQGAGTREELLRHLKEKIALFAKKYICERFLQLCKQFNVQNVKISFKFVKSWWGKCNKTKRIITFNIKLISRPADAIDGVICHEIAHLKVGNHQKEFYDYLKTLDCNYKYNRKLLCEDKYFNCDRLSIWNG